MSVTLTQLTDIYSANAADGVKRLRFTASFTNPYTAGGESITVSSYFSQAVLGAQITAIDPRVAIAAVGPMANAVCRTYSASTAAIKIQLLDCGLPGTANAGLMVDTTTANISGSTCTLEIWGR